VTWNGPPVDTTVTSAGSLLAELPGPPQVSLPALGNWKYAYETPESRPEFDDSGWVEATKTSSNSTTAVPAGQKVLFADDYGFHHGDIWYRGRYTDDALSATAVSVNYAAGGVGMVEAWLDGAYIGTHQLATPAPYSTSPAEAATVSFAIPPELRTPGPHVLAVLVHTMAHNEDGGVNDAQKAARGLVGVTLTGSPGTPIAWRIQGDQRGEDIVDTVRGPLNNGGLYGERAGWYLPGYPDAGWAPVSLPFSDPRPGVAWYRTTFDLDLPAGVDASLGLSIDDPASKAYRALIFVNGWNMGQYVNNVGPQHTFVIPNGIFRDHGRNTLALAVITNNAGGGASGGGLGTVTLTTLATVASNLAVGDVASPAYEPPDVTATPVSAVEAKPFSGQVATVAVPADAEATALDATIEWGDGTTSAGTVDGSGADRTVSGQHTYTYKGDYAVTVTLADRYGAGTIASATATATVAPRLAAVYAGPPLSPQRFDGVVARFTDAAGETSPSAFAATIDWGDGTSSAGTVAAGASAFTVSGAHVYDGTGRFTVSVTVEPPSGSSATVSGPLLVYAFPAGGAFVVGDRSASGAVTFWGSGWAAANELSGGAAPRAFKGFVPSAATPPHCGATWTAHPGASSPPPATLPDYMAVVVSSTVSQKGSTIAGDAAHVAVVEVNPGYLPDPEYAGTGDVVATVC
jgi:hypothetical protein